MSTCTDNCQTCPTRCAARLEYEAACAEEASLHYWRADAKAPAVTSRIDSHFAAAYRRLPKGDPIPAGAACSPILYGKTRAEAVAILAKHCGGPDWTPEGLRAVRLLVRAIHAAEAVA